MKQCLLSLSAKTNVFKQSVWRSVVVRQGRFCIFRPDGSRQVGDVFKASFGLWADISLQYNTMQRLWQISKKRLHMTNADPVLLFRLSWGFILPRESKPNKKKKKCLFNILQDTLLGAQINVSSPLYACSEEIFPSMTWKKLLRTCQALEARCMEYTSVWTYAGGLQYTSKRTVPTLPPEFWLGSLSPALSAILSVSPTLLMTPVSQGCNCQTESMAALPPPMIG